MTKISLLFYLIKSGFSDSTKVLGKHLLVGSRTLQRWKNDYLSGGISKLLKYEKGKHKRNGIITPAISAVIKEQLSSPTAGFTSYIDQMIKSITHTATYGTAINKTFIKLIGIIYKATYVP